MSEIDPFEAPPLVEYENCITHDELVAVLEEYTRLYRAIPRWRFIKKSLYGAAVQVLISMDYHIHQKQMKYGGTHEKID